MNSIRERIKDVILKSLDTEDSSGKFTETDNIEELGVEITSIVVLDILVNLEKEFEISLDESEINSSVVKDISALEKVVNQKLSM